MISGVRRRLLDATRCFFSSREQSATISTDLHLLTEQRNLRLSLFLDADTCSIMIKNFSTLASMANYWISCV